MKSRYMLLVFGLVVLLSSQAANALLLPRAKISIKVINEQGDPIDLAKVGIGFERSTGWGVKEIIVEGQTDREGIFTASAFGNNHVAFTVTKDGYYASTGEYDFKNHKLGRWSPWDPEVRVVMRKIGKTIPMYARIFSWEIPELEKDIGFDLIEYDWVIPYGKGISPDFIFKAEKEKQENGEMKNTLTVTFPNRLDGIRRIEADLSQGSRLKLPRFAPDNGYEDMIVHPERITAWGGVERDYDYNEHTNYIFRVRSEDDGGDLLRAMYGKIVGEIDADFRYSKTARILFKYYLNPEYNKNLEFDPTKNLFRNLKRGEGLGVSGERR